MAISQEDIKARIAQIQQAGGGDTAATRAQIAKEAQQYGVTPEQIGAATGLLGTQVRTMAEEAGQTFAPMQMTGGMLGGSNINLTTPVTPMTPRTGMLEGVTVDVPVRAIDVARDLKSGKISAGDSQTLLQEIVGGEVDPYKSVVADIWQQTTGGILGQNVVDQYADLFRQDVEAGMLPELAAIKYRDLALQTPEAGEKQVQDFVTKIEQKDPFALGSFLYSMSKTGQRVNAGELEPIFGTGQEGYVTSATAGQIMLGLQEADRLISQGKTEEAQKLYQEMQDDPVAFADRFSGGDIGASTGEIRHQLTTDNVWFGTSDPKGSYLNQAIDKTVDFVVDDIVQGFVGSAEAFFENPGEALDRWKNKPPAMVAAAVTGAILAGPAGLSAAQGIGAATTALSTINTLDAGRELSAGQIISLALHAAPLMDMANTAIYGPSVETVAASENIGAIASTAEGATAYDTIRQGAGVLSDLGADAQAVYRVVTEPVNALVNGVLDKFGGAATLIERAGAEASDQFVQGMYKGLTSAAISAATGEGNPSMKLLEELKGTEILEEFVPDIPSGAVSQWLSETGDSIVAAGEKFEDWYRDKGLDPGAITREIAKAEDWLREKGVDPGVLTTPLREAGEWVAKNIDLSGVKDLFNQAGDTIANAFEPVKDAIVDTGDAIADAGDAVADAVSGFDLPDVSLPGVVPMEELAGSGFTAKKGRQGGLAVDTDFLYEEPSLALAILEGRVA